MKIEEFGNYLHRSSMVLDVFFLFANFVVFIFFFFLASLFRPVCHLTVT